MTPEKLPREVVLLTTDLMLISSAGGAARQLGLRFRSVANASELAGLDEDSNPLLCVDLATAGDVAAELQPVVPQRVLQQAVAFGPHVHERRLAAAREAGVGRVMSRGQFVMNLPSVLVASGSAG